MFRELREELKLEISEATFFYFNEFHQASAFDNSNLLAFYYLINIQKKQHELSSAQYSIPFEEEVEKQRWIALRNLHVSDLTFPIDRIVLEKLQKEFQFTS